MFNCQELKNLYVRIIDGHKEFKGFYPEARKPGTVSGVKESREKAFACAKRTLEMIESLPEISGVIADFRINKKIAEILKREKQKFKRRTRGVPFETALWDIDYSVRKKTVSFTGLNDESLLQNPMLMNRRDVAGILIATEDTPIEALDLTNGGFTQSKIEWLITALRFDSNRLFALKLTGNYLESNGFNELWQVLKGPSSKVRILHINNCGLTDFDLDNLAGVMKSPENKLVELNLAKNTRLDPDGFQDFFYSLLDVNCKLKKLNLSQLRRFSDDATAALIGFLQNPDCRLKQLSLAGTDLSTYHEFLGALPGFRSLDVLDLSATGFYDGCIDELAIAGFGNLKKLILSKNKRLTERGQQRLLAIAKKKNANLQLVF